MFKEVDRMTSINLTSLHVTATTYCPIGAFKGISVQCSHLERQKKPLAPKGPVFVLKKAEALELSALVCCHIACFYIAYQDPGPKETSPISYGSHMILSGRVVGGLDGPMMISDRVCGCLM